MKSQVEKKKKKTQTRNTFYTVETGAYHQDPATTVPRIPVLVFSQTDLVLV